MTRKAEKQRRSVEARVARVLRDDVRALKAYHVPPAQGMLKLDAMENPYRLPADLVQELAQLVSAAELNRYPDAGAAALKARLRESMAVPAGMDLLLGNGSDEIIQILALACARPGAVLLGVEPSFVMFRMIATFAGMRFVGVPLRGDFTLDTDAVLDAIAQHCPALTFIAYPNNPSGNLFDPAGVTRIIEASPGLVVVDEAYAAFAGASFMPRLGEFPNLLVMRTLSKLGLAGLRLGLAAGNPAWIGELEKLRLPYNVNVLTQVVAERTLKYSQVLAEQASSIVAERSRLLARLQSIAGVTAYPSDANFILFRVPRADTVFDGLKQRSVLIKNLSGSHPLLADCLRVTVGMPEENDRFLAALNASLP